MEKNWAEIGKIQALVKFFLPGGTEQDKACLDPG
jgi:hypothetical protein